MNMKRLQNWVADATGIRVLPDGLLHPRDPNVETLKLKGYCQTQGHTCGFVAALMILRFFQPAFKAETLFQSIRPDKRWGVSRRRLMEKLRLYMVRVNCRRDLEFDGIVKAIDEGRPVAVMVHVDEDTKHWVVVYGYGRKPQRVYVAGSGIPLLSRKEYPWGMFKRYLWADPGFGLVCSKRVEA
jgi:hypothetical protein